ncbi:histidine kinase [Oscillatoriales cyanobacterium LEGE 11467]|uniref:Histidine kinase n=1 Tax=Zarconia navalis LEGE 11467 TaxID=1828826 RepID=A0A928VWQ6_9CYAN|nr:histidine kinase [Zarconia navalis]MBE9039568.1 histidine kinase [Zarconia navalis LEGE 11467]
MSNSLKKQIVEDLQKVKEEGSSRRDRIREIVRSAISQSASEFKEGSKEIRTIVREAVSTTIDTVQSKGDEAKEDVEGAIEGAIEAVGESKRKSIAAAQSQVKQLQNRLETEERELQEEVEDVLGELQETAKDKSSSFKAAVESAVEKIKDSEEAALMQKRYAQVKAKLAILQANLSARYGERFEEVKEHLDEAKFWYERSRSEERSEDSMVREKQANFESKLGEVGSAIGKKERKLRQLLKELWRSTSDLFQDK